jgi:LPXTG-motif cell wall-anchored protein
MQQTRTFYPVRRLTAVVVGALLLVAMAAVPALAQYPPAANLTVACAPENPGPGVTVNCTISGAPGNTELDIVVEINPTLLDTTVTTNADGEASFSFDVPGDAQDGDTITITVSGEEIEGTLDVQLTVADEEVVVDDEDELADTGVETSTLLLAGLIIATLGFGVVLASRRKERTTTKV